MSSAGVEDEEILDVLRSADESRLTTTEVAEALPITRGRTRTRLQQLADDGPVDRETVGNEVVWWLAEQDEQGDDQATEPADGQEEPDEADAPAEESPAIEEASEQPGDEATGGPAGAEGAVGDAASVETPEVDEEAEPVAAEAEAPAEADDGSDGTDDRSGGADDGPDGTDDSTDGAPDEGPAEIEVEAIGDQVTSRGSVTDADEAPPTRPEAGADAEERTVDRRGIRALGLLAAAIVVIVLLRRFLTGDGDR